MPTHLLKIEFFQARDALVELRDTGATLLFHAECELGLEEEALLVCPTFSSHIISKHVPCQEVGDPGEYNTFLNSRPPSMELSAIQLVIDICRETRVPCHIGRSQG